jgi:hypothetical protein
MDIVAASGAAASRKGGYLEIQKGIRHRDVASLIWFVLALVPMVMSQIVRLHQHDSGTWIFSDYLGRLGGLAVLSPFLRRGRLHSGVIDFA